MTRVERLRSAIGSENSSEIQPDDQLRLVLRLLEGNDVCLCGLLRDPLEAFCAGCGAPTLSPYAMPSHGLQVRPRAGESPQIATDGRWSE